MWGPQGSPRMLYLSRGMHITPGTPEHAERVAREWTAQAILCIGGAAGLGEASMDQYGKWVTAVLAAKPYPKGETKGQAISPPKATWAAAKTALTSSAPSQESVDERASSEERKKGNVLTHASIATRDERERGEGKEAKEEKDERKR